MSIDLNMYKRLGFIFLMLFSLAFGYLLFSQTPARLSISPYLGGGYSSVSGVNEMIGNENIFSNYTHDTEYKLGYIAGLALKYHIKESPFYIGLETSYSKRPTQFNLEHKANASIDDLTYQVPLDYEYWSTGTMLNVHFYKGFYLGLGGALMINTSPDQISYTSNQDEKYDDSETERTLRESFVGTNSFEWMAEIGYAHKKGFGISVRYRQSVLDMIETQGNPYNYLEADNMMDYMSAQVYYWIPLIK